VGALSCTTHQPDTPTHGHRIPPDSAQRGITPTFGYGPPAGGRSDWTSTSKLSAPPGAHDDHLRLPSGWLPLPGSSPVIGHRTPPRPCAAGWAGEDLSSSRCHYLSVPQPLTPESPSAPAHPGLGAPSLAFALHRRARHSLVPAHRRGHLTTRQASLHVTDRSVAHPQDWGARRWASTPPVSRRNRQPATGPPDSYPDRTHTGKRRRAYETEDQPHT
jgi:hypothetical protein